MTQEDLMVIAKKIKEGEATEEEKIIFHKNINVLLSEIKELAKE
jgi:hypothetical protein